MSATEEEPAARIEVSGHVEGANVVIGGVQRVDGDLVITHTVVRPVAWSRPVAPNPPAHFTGRRAELDRLAEALRAGRNTAITGVQGMGGIGKTALALRAAAESEFGAVLWASLGPEPSAVGHLVTWARHADPDFTAGDSAPDALAGRVRAALTGLVRDHCPGPVLVVIDDVWEGASVEAARLLQQAAPAGAVFLITTRSQLVVAQLRSSRVELLPLTADDALALLRALLPDHPDIADADLAELADVLGRHPLALELAAGQTRLLERPETELPDLVARYRGGVPAGSPFRDIRLELGESREDNLELVLSFSYDALSDGERECFRALGVLAYGAGFDRPLCAAVWDREPAPTLDGLRHRAMLALAPEPGWYQQHQLLRAYARALLRQDPDAHLAVEDRYTAHVTAVSAGFARPLNEWRDLEAYLPHVEEAGAILVGRPPGEAGLAFAVATRPLLAHRKEIRHPEWLELGLAVSGERGDLSYQTAFLNALSEDHAFRGDAKAAVRLLHRARQVAEAARDLPGMAATESNLGEFLLLSDPDTAPKHLWRAVGLHEQAGAADGLVDALLRIARWQANRYRGSHAEREQAFATIARAEAVAADAGLDWGVAQARMQEGALRDSLGDRAAAEAALTDAVERFAALGRRDREAEARVRLAAALACLGRTADAEAQLTSALPLVTSTGYAVVHAVALRNLAELRAREGRAREALALFAEALPLTRAQTMRFVDEDYFDETVAPGPFGACVEDVAKLDQIEHFRQTALEGVEPGPGMLPDELLSYLLVGSLRPPPDWAAALREFAAALAEPVHRSFAEALADLAEGRQAQLPDGHPYRQYILALGMRRSSGARPLSDEQAERCGHNTLAVLLGGAGDNRREWTIELRRLRRQAKEWGDEDERRFYDALLAVLDNRLAALPPANPHRGQFDRVLDILADFTVLPGQFLVERTVAVLTVAEERRAEWAQALAEVRVDAVRRGADDEAVFLAALAALLDGDVVALPADNPYAELHARAAAAREPVFAPLPHAELVVLAERVYAVHTDEPKTFEIVVADLSTLADEAERWGNAEHAELFRSLIDLLHGEAAPNPPDERLRELWDAVAQAEPVPCGDHVLPPEQVEGLARIVVRARTDAPERHDWTRDNLVGYARVLAGRSEDWRHEREFVAALVDVLDGVPVAEDAAGPYAPVLHRVLADIEADRRIRAGGGALTPDRLADLLRRTGRAWRAVQDHMAQLVQAGEFSEALSGVRTRDLVTDLIDWQEDLRQTRHLDDWGAPEADLLDALLQVTDSQPTALPDDSPYAEDFRDMLAAIDYTPGMPGMMVDSLASTKEEFSERFRDVFSGRAGFLRNLDTALDNSLAVLTTTPERAQEWLGQLEQMRAGVADLTPEVELLDQLAAVVGGAPAALPDDHPYVEELGQVLGGLEIYRGAGPLPGDEVIRLAMVTAGALTVRPDLHEPWQAELAELRAHFAGDPEFRAFLDALAVVLEGRSADLPRRNRYRCYLRLCQSQMRALASNGDVSYD